jgi:hypothetical protein
MIKQHCIDPECGRCHKSGNFDKGWKMAVGFPYAMIEAALVELNNIAPETLRSRFGAFQRGGLLGKPRGRGVRLQYGPDELHRVVLAFELTQMDISPTTVLWLVRECWDRRLREIFIKAERAIVHETPDVVLILGSLTAMEGPEEAVTNFNHTTMDKLSQSLSLVIDGQGGRPARALVVNLSAQLRRFHTALSHYHLRPDMPAELEAKPLSKLICRKGRGSSAARS